MQMFLRSVYSNNLAHSAFIRTLYSSTNWASANPNGKPIEKSAEKPTENTAVKESDATSKDEPPKTSTTQPEQEKIEYIGNTKFPKPRIKPRRTITPGDAVGQNAPAEKLIHPPLNEKIAQKWRDVLSPEKNLENRAKIIDEISESYFQNILDLRNNGPKLFEAPAQLIPTKKAKFLPNLEGKTLNGADVDIAALCHGKVTLLTVEFVKFAEKHTMSYISVFEKEFADNKKTQVVQVNVEENWAKGAILRMCIPYVKRSIPKHRHDTYVVHYGAVDNLKRMLGIANPLIGYSFLIDRTSRIRWYANGEAADSEGATMAALTLELLRQSK